MNEKATLEDNKIRIAELEIQKLEAEIISIHRSEARKWITTISIIVGIAVSLFGALTTLAEINNRNKQLSIEAQIRSHEIFLNQVLSRVGSVIEIESKLNNKNELVETTTKSYDSTVQMGGFAAAVSLSEKFPGLLPISIEVLEWHAKSVGEKARSKKFLEKLYQIREK